MFPPAAPAQDRLLVAIDYPHFDPEHFLPRIELHASLKPHLLERAEDSTTKKITAILDTGCDCILTGGETLHRAKYIYSQNLHGRYLKWCEDWFNRRVRGFEALKPIRDHLGEPLQREIGTVNGDGICYAQSLYLHLVCTEGNYAGRLYPLNAERQGRIFIVDSLDKMLLGLEPILDAGLSIHLKTLKTPSGSVVGVRLEIYGPELTTPAGRLTTS